MDHANKGVKQTFIRRKWVGVLFCVGIFISIFFNIWSPAQALSAAPLPGIGERCCLVSGSCSQVGDTTACAAFGGVSTPCNNPACKGIQSAFGELVAGGRHAGFAAVQEQPEVVIGKIIQGMILVIGVIFGLLVIYGGYLWMIARGNEEMVKKAKGILETAVIGIILVVGAYAITSYVVERVITAAYQATDAETPPPVR